MLDLLPQRLSPLQQILDANGPGILATHTERNLLELRHDLWRQLRQVFGMLPVRRRIPILTTC